MKEGYETCPYCANEIRKWAIKCQYCHEFLRDESWNVKEINNLSDQSREVNRVKKWSKRRKWWLFLVLIEPIIMVIWLVVSVIFWSINNTVSAQYDWYWSSNYWNYYWYDSYDYYDNYRSASLLDTIKSAINWLLWILSTLWLIGFVPWVLMLAKPDTDYDPDIKLKTKLSDLYNVYDEDFDINSLPRSDISEMKYNWLISKLHVAWAVILNILTLWWFSIIYYWLKYSDLPKIKEDDYCAWKAIWYLFIPFYNLYRICVFWLRLVDRLNFQYTIRGKTKPISRSLAITCIVFNFIPYLNFASIGILQSVLVWKMQNAINSLVSEK